MRACLVGAGQGEPQHAAEQRREEQKQDAEGGQEAGNTSKQAAHLQESAWGTGGGEAWGNDKAVGAGRRASPAIASDQKPLPSRRWLNPPHAWRNSTV